MAKLKFDRSINLYGRDGEVARVPNDEVWKGTLAIRYSGSELSLNSIDISSSRFDKYAPPIYTTLGGGAEIKSTVFGFTFTGFAFKIIN